MEKRASLNEFSKYEYKEKAATHQMWKRGKLFSASTECTDPWLVLCWMEKKSSKWKFALFRYQLYILFLISIYELMDWWKLVLIVLIINEVNVASLHWKRRMKRCLLFNLLKIFWQLNFLYLVLIFDFWVYAHLHQWRTHIKLYWKLLSNR